MPRYIFYLAIIQDDVLNNKHFPQTWIRVNILPLLEPEKPLQSIRTPVDQYEQLLKIIMRNSIKEHGRKKKVFAKFAIYPSEKTISHARITVLEIELSTNTLSETKLYEFGPYILKRHTIPSGSMDLSTFYKN